MKSNLNHEMVSRRFIKMNEEDPKCITFVLKLIYPQTT